MTTHATHAPERALCGMTREDHDALALLEPRSPFRLLPAGERPRCRYCRALLDAQNPPEVRVPDAVPDSDGAARRLSVLLSQRAEATGRRVYRAPPP